MTQEYQMNRKQYIDQIAAAVILQSYLDSLHAQGTAKETNTETGEEELRGND